MNIDKERERIGNFPDCDDAVGVSKSDYSRLLDLLEAVRPQRDFWLNDGGEVSYPDYADIIATANALDEAPPWTPTVNADAAWGGPLVTIRYLTDDGDACVERDGSLYIVRTADLRPPMEADHD